MRKILALTLCLIMALSVIPAMAEETVNTLPPAFFHSKINRIRTASLL